MRQKQRAHIHQTHRLASTVTHVHRHIAQAVAVKDSCLALIGAHQHSIAVESMNGNLWFRPFRATHESFKLFSLTDVNTFYEKRRIRLLIDVYLWNIKKYTLGSNFLDIWLIFLATFWQSSKQLSLKYIFEFMINTALPPDRTAGPLGGLPHLSCKRNQIWNRDYGQAGT